VTTERSRTRCRDRLRLLSSSALEYEEFRHEAVEVLRETVGFSTSCWVLSDPASLLPTIHDMGEADAAFHASIPRLTALHQGHEAASDRATAGAQEPAVTMSAMTGGDLSKSQLWDECLRPHGLGDCFFLACRDRHGCWGWVNASREKSEASFTAEDIRLLEDVSTNLATTMRRMMAGDPAAQADPPPSGVIICDHHLRETSWTPEAHQWLAQLPDEARWREYGLLPPAVYGVAGRLLAGGDGDYSTVARARVLTTTGTWAVLDGGRLEGDGGGRVAITIRAATADEVLDILCQACDLTPRETQLVRLVVAGLNTQQLAERLVITPYTVKDHLKAVFEKVGVQSRGELVGRMTGHRPGTNLGTQHLSRL